jgi:monoamine oxidase
MTMAAQHPRVDGPRLDRRRFLAALLASASLPSWARAQSGNPDVVIVGAGAAGLAAAHTLAEKGLSFVLIEAKDRIGGRAFTDTASFGLPFDHGCSWLHQSNRNPFKPIAESAGFTLLPHDDAGEAVFVGERPANAAELEAYGEAWDATINTIARLGSRIEDVAPAASIPVALPWSHVSNSWIGPMSMGADVDEFSAVDWYQLDSTAPNLMIREGYGTLVAQYGRDVPVSLATPARTIRWGGDGVAVETDAGTISAKACILTVSTGVLAAETIRFDPPLPAEKLAAIEGLPMGLLGKIPLQFQGTRFGLTPNDWLTYAATEEQVCYFLSWPFDMDLMIGWVGGRFGWELSKGSEAEAVDFALGELRRIFGTDIDGHFVKGRFTQWANDPDMRGAYAHQRPGAARARNELAKPLAERLFFAGEATAGGMSMTCGGAFNSGVRAARETARALG